MTTAAKRVKKKNNRTDHGKHTGYEHIPGQRCLTCRPLPLTEYQKDMAMVSRFLDRAKFLDHTNPLLALQARSGARALMEKYNESA